MRIIIKKKYVKRRLLILFPTAMVFNRFTAFLFIIKQSKRLGCFSREQKKSVYLFVREINKYKRRKDKIPFIEVDGDESKIIITF